MPFRVTAKNRDQTFTAAVAVAGPTLLEVLQSQSVPIKSSCMGKGVCRQCRVQVQKGLAPVQNADRKAFSDEQLQAGWRLSCCIRPRAAMDVFFPQTYVFQDAVKVHRQPVSDWWYACDLGTTGVEIAAVDSQGVWAIAKSLNKQVIMGADVMTRLEYAMKNGVQPVYERGQKQLLELCDLLDKKASAFVSTQKMFVAGNSVVTSFLVQASVEQLGVAPYQPEFTASQTTTLGRLKVTTLPLLHSFVGGDLWAGVYVLWHAKKFLAKPWVLMDVGTNSEILFWDGTTLFVSSTPAGPAFEGSSISIGMRAEPGAVINPTFNGTVNAMGGVWDFQTVADDIPKGICGSALVQMVAESVKAGVVSIDGEVLKADGMKLTNSLALTQDDIREFQLAKSAIRTGLDLVQAEGTQPPEVLYLAGSFGENLPLTESKALGLLPEWPVETLGNSSLDGTILWGQATDAERAEFTAFVNSKMKPIELALRDEFQAAFVQNMNLG
jgi:uncharacterized 2Fe-2S/4Fe-4S cluster protein (DUF4445 family)